MKKAFSLLLSAILSVGISSMVFAESTAEPVTIPPEAEATSQHICCDESCVEDIKVITIPDEEFEELNIIGEFQQTLIHAPLAEEGTNFRSEYDFSSDYFLNQMTESEKALYKTIKTKFEEVINSKADLTNHYICSIPLGEPMDKDRIKQMYTTLYYTNPQLYHINSGIGISESGTTVGLWIIEEYKSYAARAAVETELEKTTNEYMEAIKSCTTEYEKAKTIADKMCRDITYNLNANHHQTVHGALVDKECVCNGFAMAYTYLCNAVDIDCIGYRNLPHAWNKIKIDGTWYETDVTWMNSDDNYLFNYFYFLNSYQNILDKDTSGSHIQDEYSVPLFKLPDCTVAYDHGFYDGPIKNLKAEKGNGSIKVSWDPSYGASGYKIYRFGNDEMINLGIIYTNSYNDFDESLVDGTDYYYAVNSYVCGWTDYVYTERVKFTAACSAKSIDAAYADGKITVSWEAPGDAESYVLWRYTYGDEGYVKIGTITDEFYVDTDIKPGKNYSYCISAIVNGKGAPYLYMNHYVEVPDIKAPTVKCTAQNGKVTLEWNKIDNATSYRVYRADTQTGQRVLLKAVTTTSFTDETVSTGNTYYYYVAAFNSDVSVLSGYSDAVVVTVSPSVYAPTITSLTSGAQCANLKWSAVDGATSYRIYRRDPDGTGTGALIKTVTGTSYTDPNLTAGKIYTYFIRAYNGNTSQISGFSSGRAICICSVAAPSNITIKSGSSKVMLSWDKVDGATSYRVYRAESQTGTKVEIKKLTGTSFTDTNVKAGKTYFYYLRAYNGTTSKISGYSSGKAICVSSIDIPKMTSISSNDNSVTVNWDAVDGATSYRVYRSTTPNSGISLVKSVNSTTFTLTDTVSSSGTYYYYVKAYNDNTGSLSSYSDYLTVKIG